MKEKYEKFFDKTYAYSINFTGKSKTGGLTNTPFGSITYNAFWTIKGEDQNSPRYECGTSHKNDLLSNLNPNMVMTHHTIWFRGDPLSEEEHRDRMMKKLNNQ